MCAGQVVQLYAAVGKIYLPGEALYGVLEFVLADRDVLATHSAGQHAFAQTIETARGI